VWDLLEQFDGLDPNLLEHCSASRCTFRYDPAINASATLTLVLLNICLRAAGAVEDQVGELYLTDI
jgi:hypothetical protein